jgi:hypothetical protein
MAEPPTVHLDPGGRGHAVGDARDAVAPSSENGRDSRLAARRRPPCPMRGTPSLPAASYELLSLRHAPAPSSSAQSDNPEGEVPRDCSGRQPGLWSRGSAPFRAGATSLARMSGEDGRLSVEG